MIKHIVLIICLICSAIQAHAITLEEAIQKALKQSEQAKINMSAKQSALASARKITSFTLPQIKAGARYTEMDTNAPDNPFMPSPDRNYNASVEGSQLLWSGGQIWNSYRLKNSLISLAELQKKSDDAELIKQVSDAYVTVLFQKALTDILNDRVRQRTSEHQDAIDLFNVGMVSHLDVREAALNLNLSKSDLKSGQTDYRAALIDFNTFIGQPIKDLLLPETLLKRNHAIDQHIQALENQLTAGHQRSIQLAKENVRSTHNSLRISKGNDYPNLSLFAGTETSGETTDEMNESWKIGLNLEWKLFTGGENSAARAVAVSDHRKAQYAYKKVKKEIAAAIEKLKSDTDSLKQQIQLQEHSLKLAEQNYIDARELYHTGQITLTRLGSFNLAYAESRFALIKLYYFENRLGINIQSLLY